MTKAEKKVRKRYIKEHGGEVTELARDMNLRQRNIFAYALPEKEQAMAAAREAWDLAYELGRRTGYAQGVRDTREGL